jgi:amidophosphoribosyltransferase
MQLWKDKGQEDLLQKLYTRCKELQRTGALHTENMVKQVYAPFSTQEISDKIAQLITPSDITFPVQVIFQTIESLHEACPTNTGDWYFTGNYPTPGGNRVVNKAFLNFMEGKNIRGY